MSTPAHFWLVTGHVVTRNKAGIERTRNKNALTMTEKPIFARKDMAKAQHAIAQQFVLNTVHDKGFEIVDIIILSVSSLGLMTPEEFHSGFEEVSPAAAPAAENDSKKGLN
jgi:hypothetical protein